MADGAVYKKIVNYLKRSIVEGRLKIGDAVYSENHLCEKFKVSRTSVRKAVRQMVDENLLVSRQGVGTFVKSTGHGIIHHSVCLVNHHTRTLRFDFTDTYYMDLVYGAEEAVNRQALNFQLFSAPLYGEDDVRGKMAHVKVDGVLVDGVYLNSGNPAFFSRLTPHVVVLDGDPEETEFPCVVPDAEAAFRELLAPASRRGGTRFYLYEDFNSRSRWRQACFRRADRAFDGGEDTVYVNYAENITPDNFSHLDHYYLIARALEKAMGAHPDCRTILADSDHAAIKAVNYLKHKNYVVPDDIAVSGFSGMNLSAMIDPKLTTVMIDSRQMAEAAVEFLIAHIEGGCREQVRMVPGRILFRESLKI